MIARGRVQNGVIVLDGGISLPEGTVVQVLADSPVPAGCEEPLAAEERVRIQETMEHIASLPVEGSPEPFSGAPHDRGLYGYRE